MDTTRRTLNLLVVANETVEGDALHEQIVRIANHRAVRVHIVAPALNTRLRHFLSDEDAARDAADERLGRCLAELHLRGVDADGHVGDADPILAIEDAIAMEPVDELLIATHPEERSNWLARGVVERALRFGLPTAHLVVHRTREPALALAA